MNKFQKEVEKKLLENEKKIIAELKKTYNKAQADIEARLKVLQSKLETQSVIYQVNYQKALKKQIGAILDVLEQDNVTNMETFLEQMYEDGYLGVQYALTKEGIPVIVPINQEEVLASLNRKIDKMTFAEREHFNMNTFKKIVKDEITRGIANASTFKEIANQLSLVTQEAYYKSYRIARTEGGRVTSEAKLKAQKKAKEQGADIVKQWDSTYDNKTRPHHRILDGQIAEIDEKFKVAGLEVEAPKKFGIAKEDINCRCILLTRARWALSDTRDKMAELETAYGEKVTKLIKSKNYEEYKKGNFKLLEEDPSIVKAIERGNKRIKEYEAVGGYKNWLALNGDKLVKKSIITTKKDALDYIKDVFKVVDGTGNINLMEEKLLIRNMNQLMQLDKKFNLLNKVDRKISFLNDKKNKYTMAVSDKGESGTEDLLINILEINTTEDVIKIQKLSEALKYSMPSLEENHDIYSITHEYGHILHNALVNQEKYNLLDKLAEERKKGNTEETRKIIRDINTLMEEKNSRVGELDKEILKIASELAGRKVKVGEFISDYGKTNKREYFAEVFANSQLGKPNILGKAMNIWLERKGLIK